MSPAAPKSPARAMFHEVLVEGSPERCHGLLTGLVLGSGVAARIYFSDDVGIRTPMGERILEFVHLHAGVCHVVADAAARRVLKKHAADLAANDMRVMDEKKIVGARFEYSFHAYAREYGKEIRALLKSLPRALKHQGGPPKETVDKEAAGVEAYSPVHHYEIEGEGSFSSPRIDLLIQAHRALDEHPLVKPELIDLELA